MLLFNAAKLQNNPKIEVQKSLLIGLKITIFSFRFWGEFKTSEMKHLCPFHRDYIHFQLEEEIINFTYTDKRNLSFI